MPCAEPIHGIEVAVKAALIANFTGDFSDDGGDRFGMDIQAQMVYSRSMCLLFISLRLQRAISLKSVLTLAGRPRCRNHSRRIRGARLLTITSLLPLPLIMIVRMLWSSPSGASIGAATGVSLGGLMPMQISLLPVWAGLVWLLAFRPRRHSAHAIP
jgi:hypothetical protein